MSLSCGLSRLSNDIQNLIALEVYKCNMSKVWKEMNHLMFWVGSEYTSGSFVGWYDMKGESHFKLYQFSLYTNSCRSIRRRFSKIGELSESIDCTEYITPPRYVHSKEHL